MIEYLTKITFKITVGLIVIMTMGFMLYGASVALETKQCEYFCADNNLDYNSIELWSREITFAFGTIHTTSCFCEDTNGVREIYADLHSKSNPQCNTKV